MDNYKEAFESIEGRDELGEIKAGCILQHERFYKDAAGNLKTDIVEETGTFEAEVSIAVNDSMTGFKLQFSDSDDEAIEAFQGFYERYEQAKQSDDEIRGLGITFTNRYTFEYFVTAIADSIRIDEEKHAIHFMTLNKYVCMYVIPEALETAAIAKAVVEEYGSEEELKELEEIIAAQSKEGERDG